ncbi:DUF805 domain-containing protein [uncultured Parasphingopyxis sp.]|uniref:DUF805 domain-containing protein n=1 Tax=uncultured Parasphingopyxis sp. TaxID=1547918 RepID=UPI00261FB9AB|nr:DUF805 domain-containing protein [uncultured Parasphingopyxis sp.]
MAYEPMNENIELFRSGLLRALNGVFRFSGRTRRTDLVVYAILATAANFIAVGIASVILGFYATFVVRFMVQILLFIPMPALFIRRLHDQDRSGWLGLVALPPIAITFWRDIEFLSVYAESFVDHRIVPREPHLVESLAFIVLSLLTLVLAFWPGSMGANRYGEDPRP